MKNIVIAGISGQSKVIIDIIEKQNQYTIVGLIDPFAKIGEEVFGYPVIGAEQSLERLKDELKLYGYSIGIGDNWIRSKVFHKINGLNIGLIPVNAVHPSASIGKNVSLGQGNVVMANVNIGCDTKIGDFCILNNNSSIDHDSIMDDFSSIAPGVITGGKVSIGEFSAISIGATVKHNINIGKHSVIGAASLVLNDIESNVVAYGIPAKKIRDRNIGDKYL